VDEYLTGQRINMAPQTFHMGSLLQEMREIEEQEYKHAPQRGKSFSPRADMGPLNMDFSMYMYHSL
jgi:hypothetical protein